MPEANLLISCRGGGSFKIFVENFLVLVPVVNLREEVEGRIFFFSGLFKVSLENK